MSFPVHQHRAPRQGSWSVYIHFPWCLKRCAYCDFATAVAAKIPRRAYREALLGELALRTVGLQAAPIASVFFGGGTPSLWGPEHVGAVLDWLASWSPIATDAEITLEANPGALQAWPLREYCTAGINRISVGVQALDDHRLTQLDRLHDAATAHQTLAELARLLHSGSLRSASADLIFGAPGQGVAELRADVEGVVAYGLPHLSAYALTVEEGTPLATRVRRGLQEPPDDDLQAQMLDCLPELLAPVGLQRYEVSNFARPGHQSVHNLVYWRGGHWLAAGVGAHGNLPGMTHNAATDLRDQRYGNHRQYAAWDADLAAGRLPEAQREVIDSQTATVERVLTELRLTEGLDLERLARDVGHDRTEALRVRALALVSDLPLHVGGGRIRVLPQAFGQLDRMIRALT